MRRPPPPQQRHAQHKPPRRRGGFLSALFYLFLFVVIIAGAGVAYLVVNPPSDFIRQTIADQVKAKTGRDFVVSGPAAFSFYPGLGVTLQDVTLSGPPGSKTNVVSIGELDINIKTMPLINRQVEIRRLILRKPVFDLRVDKVGKKNWDLAQLGDPVRYAQAQVPSEAPEGTTIDSPPAATDAPAETPARPAPRLPKSLSEIQHLQLDDVRIEDGILRYTDERTGKTQQVSAANLQVSLKSLQAPLIAHGNFAWQGQKVDFDGKMSNVMTMLEEKPSRLTFTASNTNVNTSFDGTVLVKDGADIEGKLDAKSPSVKNLAKWFGTVLPPVAGFGPMSFNGDVKTTGNVTSIANAKIGLDGTTATGNATVTTGGVRPYVQTNLKISELDLNKYMVGGAPIAAAAPSAQTAPQPAAKSTAPAETKDAIENLLNNPPPASKVYGATQRAGWSSEAINLALLGVADTDAKLQIGRLIFQQIHVGQSALTVALKNRVMKTTFDDVQLYEGHGKGFLNVDGTGATANIGANIGLDGISSLPFLKDSAGITWLAGKAKLGLQLAANGASQLQLVENLNGRADLTFADGAVVGFNLPGAIRGLGQGKFNGLKQAPSEKTDFSELSATFNIQNGIAQNQDLKLISPLLRVSGAGAVHLPQRTLDYTVKPKIVASLEGSQSSKALSGLEIPVRISGPWAKPEYAADLKGVLADPSKAVEAVKEIGKQFKGKSAGEIVNDLLGKKSDDGSGTTSGAKNLLKNLLKPQPQPQPQ